MTTPTTTPRLTISALRKLLQVRQVVHPSHLTRKHYRITSLSTRGELINYVRDLISRGQFLGYIDGLPLSGDGRKAISDFFRVSFTLSQAFGFEPEDIMEAWIRYNVRSPKKG